MTEAIGRFRKSSYSGQEGNCVEVAHTATGRRAVRDSKDPARPMLTFGPSSWHGFLGGAKSEKFRRSAQG